MVMLCYVDDLLITGESDEAIYHVVEQLKGAVKLKVTVDRDGQITFLGRLLTRDHSSDSLYVTMSDSYYEEIYKSFFGSSKVTPTYASQPQRVVRQRRCLSAKTFVNRSCCEASQFPWESVMACDDTR